MALKSKVIEDSEADEDSDSDEEEMAMYARKFRRFIKKNKIWKKNRSQSSRDEPKKEFKKEFKKDSKKDSQIICYNCNKPGYVKQDCKLPKKHSKYVKKSKGKAMAATWSDSDESSSEDDEEIEEMENLGLMATKEEESSNEDEKVYDLYTFDELQEAFDDLSSKFEKLGSKHIALKRNFSKLEAKVKALEKEKAILI